MQIDWGVAIRPIPGEQAAGDLYVVQKHSWGVLLAVVDGIGHGPEAAQAAETAVNMLREHAHRPVVSLMNRCHQALADTRGAVATLASVSFEKASLTWCGVGNVEAFLFHQSREMGEPERALLRGGTLGSNLPILHTKTVPIVHGDTLIIASDGIRPEFEQHVATMGKPQRIADGIIERFSRYNDDACVLVTRFLCSDANG